MEMEKMEVLASAMQDVSSKVGLLNAILVGEDEKSDKTTLDKLICALEMHTEAVSEQNRLTRMYIQAMEDHAKALRASVDAMEQHRSALSGHDQSMTMHGQAMNKHGYGMQEHGQAVSRHANAMTYR